MRNSRERSGSLTGFSLLLLLTAACSPGAPPAAAPTPAAAVSGFYEGSLQSQQHGEVQVSINLRHEDGSLLGMLATPLGDFPLLQDSLTPERVILQFVVGDGDVGRISGEWDASAVRGTWTLGDDGGAIVVRRVGPSRPPIEPARVTLDLANSAWREDLHHLATTLPQRHGNAFHTVSREAFEDSVRALEGRLPALRGHEVFAAMGRLVALVGDGHTYLQLPETFLRYPIRLYAFGDTLRVTHTAAGYEQLLGARVLGIGGTDIHEARRLVGRQIARENEQYVLKELPWFLVHAEVLHAHGVIADPGAADWMIETLSGERVTVRLTPLASSDDVRWVSAAQVTPLYRQRSGEELWQVFLAESGTLYVGFRGYPARPAFREFFENVLRFVDANPVERMVIDLRQNAGGDFTKVRDLLLPALKQHRIHRRGRLFVAIGRHTFSAAMTNAADFLLETEAILVGEPTGARPNGWQEKGQFTLPHSHLTVSVSTQYYRFLADDLPAVMPHEHIPVTWDDFRAGRDAVLDWIITQPLPR